MGKPVVMGVEGQWSATGAKNIVISRMRRCRGVPGMKIDLNRARRSR